MTQNCIGDLFYFARNADLSRILSMDTKNELTGIIDSSTLDRPVLLVGAEIEQHGGNCSLWLKDLSDVSYSHKSSYSHALIRYSF